MVSHIIVLQDTVTQNFREKKSYFRNAIANLSRSYLNQHRWSPNTKLLTRTFRTTPIYIYIYYLHGWSWWCDRMTFRVMDMNQKRIPFKKTKSGMVLLGVISHSLPIEATKKKEPWDVPELRSRFGGLELEFQRSC